MGAVSIELTERDILRIVLEYLENRHFHISQVRYA